LGIFDLHRFRGESGGDKSHFTLSETDATPSYRDELVGNEVRSEK
jgi:hypothetical protein